MEDMRLGPELYGVTARPARGFGTCRPRLFITLPTANPRRQGLFSASQIDHPMICRRELAGFKVAATSRVAPGPVCPVCVYSRRRKSPDSPGGRHDCGKEEEVALVVVLIVVELTAASSATLASACDRNSNP